MRKSPAWDSLVMIEIGVKTEWTKRSSVLVKRSNEVMSVSESMASVVETMSSINWHVSGVRGGMPSIDMVISCKKEKFEKKDP